MAAAQSVVAADHRDVRSRSSPCRRGACGLGFADFRPGSVRARPAFSLAFRPPLRPTKSTKPSSIKENIAGSNSVLYRRPWYPSALAQSRFDRRVSESMRDRCIRMRSVVGRTGCAGESSTGAPVVCVVLCAPVAPKPSGPRWPPSSATGIPDRTLAPALTVGAHLRCGYTEENDRNGSCHLSPCGCSRTPPVPVSSTASPYLLERYFAASQNAVQERSVDRYSNRNTEPADPFHSAPSPFRSA